MRQSTGKYKNKLLKLFESSSSIVLTCHTNPDGDAIGSMLGLYHYLRSKGKQCTMIAPTALPEYLLWLDCANDILVYENSKKESKKIIQKADLFIFLDFNSFSRIVDLKSEFSKYDTALVLIDHHPQPDIEAQLLVSEPNFSSTSELVYNLIEHLENEPFTLKEYNEAIYVGMMTDTGNFSFGSYDGETMRIVGLLLDSGLQKDYIIDKVYDNFSADSLRLQGFALVERMHIHSELNTAYIYLSKNDLEMFNYKVGDTEGFVNLPLSISGILVSVLLIEKTKHIKLSLRSKGAFSVNELARKYFNGGGHTNAAGGRLDMTMDESLKYFKSVIEKESVSLKEAKL